MKKARKTKARTKTAKPRKTTLDDLVEEIVELRSGLRVGIDRVKYMLNKITEQFNEQKNQRTAADTTQTEQPATLTEPPAEPPPYMGVKRDPAR